MKLLRKNNIYEVFEIELDINTGVQNNLLDEYYIKFKTNLYWLSETYNKKEEAEKRFEEIKQLVNENKIIIIK